MLRDAPGRWREIAPFRDPRVGVPEKSARMLEPDLGGHRSRDGAPQRVRRELRRRQSRLFQRREHVTTLSHGTEVMREHRGVDPRMVEASDLDPS